ncbi:MAG: hypothetical protein EU532_11150 [Promethearchaeota archaeon]|nr:MAG: hypothetical protein EU532_11150 [Candidatus Lokiarchaeota archaeon]
MAKRKKKKTAGETLASTLKEKKSKKSSGEPTETLFESTTETQDALQSLLQGVSEGAGFYKRENKEEDLIEPQLIYDVKSKIAEDYAMEDIPISDRKLTEKKKTPLTDSELSKIEEIKVEELPSPPKSSVGENIYENLELFFTDYLKGYSERYNTWEESVSNVLSILRKMRKFTKKNTEDLIDSINNLFKKIEINLQQFKVKRDEIEKIAGVDIETMSGEFKKVLGLLELQVKEYQLKKLTDEFIHQQQMYSEL